MRTSKSILAGIAAGALGLALVPFAASSAQASTVTVDIAFPSMTLIQDTNFAVQIPVTTKTNGVATNLSGAALVGSITNVDGASVVGSAATNFYDDTAALNTQSSGVSGWRLAQGSWSGTGATNITGIAPGSYTFSVTAVSTTTGVAIARATMPFAVVATASASAITGKATFVDAQSLTASAVGAATVATSSTVSAAGTQYVAFTNAAGGPIVGATGLYSVTAAPTSAGASGTVLSTVTASGSAAGIYSFSTSAGDTWSATPGTGTYTAAFANPVNQLTGTRSVNLSASAAMTGLEITSAISGDVSGSISGSPDAEAAIPATSGVKFTVSGVTTVSSVATAGVPVTFSVAGRTGTNSGSDTAYSNISPITATTVTSGAGGNVSVEYTVQNPVNGKGILVTATYPGGSKTFFVQLQTPTIAAVVVAAPDVTAANTGTVPLGAVVVDQFSQPIANWPVQVAVTGVGSTSTPANLTTNAAGEVGYAITVPSGTQSGATSTVTFTAWNGTAYATYTAQVAVTYTSGSAAVSSLAVTGSFNAAASSYSTLTDGKLNTSDNPMFVNTATDVTAAYTPANDGFAWKIQAVATNSAGAVLAGAPVTITPADGGYVRNPTTGRWATSVTVYSNTSGVVTAVLAALKTGDISYTVASGTASATVKARYANRPTDARTVDIKSSADRVQAGSGATITATVTDRFGNPVPGVPVTFNETGPGYIAGTGGGTTGAAGNVEATYVTVIGQSGKSLVGVLVGSTASVSLPTALPSSSAQVYGANTYTLQVGNAKDTVTSYAIPAGSTTPVTYSVLGAAAGLGAKNMEIEVTTEPTGKTIVIAGERGTVSGKSGIIVDGDSTGFARGDILKPFVRFPGETEYAMGSANISVDATGGFTWQRKTGKKIYVYVATEDGAVKSNRLIIAAS